MGFFKNFFRNFSVAIVISLSVGCGSVIYDNGECCDSNYIAAYRALTRATELIKSKKYKQAKEGLQELWQDYDATLHPGQFQQLHAYLGYLYALNNEHIEAKTHFILASDSEYAGKVGKEAGGLNHTLLPFPYLNIYEIPFMRPLHGTFAKYYGEFFLDGEILPLVVAPPEEVNKPCKLKDASVVVGFDVDENGLTTNIHIIEDHCKGPFVERVKQAVYLSAYRPRTINGQSVKVEGVKKYYKWLPKRHASSGLEP